MLVFSRGLRLINRFRGAPLQLKFVWRSLYRMSKQESSYLSFDSYDAYGFDIDHTLAKYNIPRLFTVG
jgi:hypothetical protein